MEKIDYGVDAPSVLRNFFLSALTCLAIAFTFWHWHSGYAACFLWAGIGLAAFGAFMWLYVRFGKFRHRDRMLRLISWRGDEKVLDVGTGRGLLLIGAAKRLELGKGRATGIDIWSQKDMGANSAEHTWRNAEAEGVKDRVDLVSEDASQMSFSDNAFDVILSNLCLHNIPSREGREQACRQIARVLKPGGTALISDFMNTSAYAKIFASCGLKTKRVGPYFADTFPPLSIVIAQKSG